MFLTCYTINYRRQHAQISVRAIVISSSSPPDFQVQAHSTMLSAQRWPQPRESEFYQTLFFSFLVQPIPIKLILIGPCISVSQFFHGRLIARDYVSIPLSHNWSRLLPASPNTGRGTLELWAIELELAR